MMTPPILKLWLIAHLAQKVNPIFMYLMHNIHIEARA